MFSIQGMGYVTRKIAPGQTGQLLLIEMLEVAINSNRVQNRIHSKRKTQ